MVERALVPRERGVVLRRGDNPVIAAKRAAFIDRMTPHIGPILTEGGYFSEALSSLTDIQRLVFFQTVVEHAAVLEFGKQPRESEKLVKQQGRRRFIFPLEEKYRKIFEQAGIPVENIGMIAGAAENVRTASRQDFTI